MTGTALRIRSFDGRVIELTRERLRHIIYRHPELEGKEDHISRAVSEPDEAYLDPAGNVHALKRVAGGPSDYIVVIYTPIGDEGGFIRTAFFTSERRKRRRYRWFRRLRVS